MAASQASSFTRHSTRATATSSLRPESLTPFEPASQQRSLFDKTGETKKRDLFWGDAAGIRLVYRNVDIPFTVGWSTQGADAVIDDFGGSAYRRDILFVHVDNPWGDNAIHYRYGYDLSTTTGKITGGLSSDRTVPGWVGHETSGLGVAVESIGHESQKDMLLSWIDDPAGSNKVYYKVGWDINDDGNPAQWSSQRYVTTVDDRTYGLGVDLANIDGDSELDMILMWVGLSCRVYYKIGWDISTEGYPAYWSSTRDAFTIEGACLFGAGIRMADINANGILDAVAVVTRAYIGDYQQFKMLWDISSSGWFGGATAQFRTYVDGGAGAGVDVTSLQSSTPLEILLVGWFPDVWSDKVTYHWT